MRNKSLKTLGIAFMIATILLAALSYWMWSDLKDIKDEGAKNAELARSGQPMGGRFKTKSESDAEAMKYNIGLVSFVSCYFTLSLAVICLYKYFSKRKEKHEPAR